MCKSATNGSTIGKNGCVRAKIRSDTLVSDLIFLFSGYKKLKKLVILILHFLFYEFSSILQIENILRRLGDYKTPHKLNAEMLSVALYFIRVVNRNEA